MKTDLPSFFFFLPLQQTFIDLQYSLFVQTCDECDEVYDVAKRQYNRINGFQCELVSFVLLCRESLMVVMSMLQCGKLNSCII